MLFSGDRDYCFTVRKTDYYVDLYDKCLYSDDGFSTDPISVLEFCFMWIIHILKKPFDLIKTIVRFLIKKIRFRKHD